MKMKGLTQDKIQLQFLELLRAGMWGKSADASLFEDGAADWKKILAHAKMQAVMPLVYDGIVSLPERLRPDLPTMYRLMAFTDKIERLNGKLDRAAGELSEKLSGCGIRSVLLKGQGNAVLYPNPARRQCGDIDLYVGEDNFGRTMSLLSEWGMVDNLAEPTYKHSHFEWDGVTVEVHKLAADPSETSASFAEWERKSLQDTDCTVILDGRSVLVPPPTYNALFIFVHAFHHFMTQGIGLRQLCDLALLLTAKHDEIDSVELLERLRMYKLMKEWDFFCRLCHEDLGMDASMAFSDTCMSDKTLKKALRLHEFIFSEGNFGTYTKGNGYYFDKPYIVRKTISLYRHNRRYMQRFAIAPGQTVSHYMNTLNSGFRAVLKHK